MTIPILLLVAASYFIGGIPTGYLIAKHLKGIDIREHGSGNPGTANVYRIVGKKAGIATLAADSLKGFIPVLTARHYFPQDYRAMILCGAMAIVGHIWTVFLNFRGGKGVATSAGVFAALLPLPALLTVLVFLTGLGVSGHISVGSMSAALALPLLALALGAPVPLTVLAGAVCALIMVKHIPNIRRLLAGQEPKLQSRPNLED